MNIYSLQELPAELFTKFTDVSSGESPFSVLQSSQTGNKRTVTLERLALIKNSPDHIMLIATEDGELFGQTVCQRVTGIANSYLYLHDLVVSEQARGKGLGTKLVSEILLRAKAAWPEIVRAQCTSRPSRGTGPFFEKMGFRARTKESGDETIVYVKDFGDYSS